MTDHLNAGQSDRLCFQIFQNIQELFHTCEIFNDLLWDTATGMVKKKNSPRCPQLKKEKQLW